MPFVAGQRPHNFGKPMSEEAKKKLSEAKKGKKATSEQRAAMSVAQKRIWENAPEARRLRASETIAKVNEEYWTEDRVRERGKQHSEWSAEYWTPERRETQSDRQMGTKWGLPAAGFCYDKRGYRILTGQQGHPLVDRRGTLREHRKVLYDEIGPGPHECHWNRVSGCGSTALDWGGRHGIQADHLDGDVLNNDPDNLVPSCLGCNAKRRHAGNPIDWDGS